MAQKTAGLVNFTDQLTAAFPDRRLPDGWIGDEAHQDSTSSHNPDDTSGSRPEWEDADSTADVRAVDVATDFGCDVSGRDVVRHLVDLDELGTVIRYIIHDGSMWHVDDDFDEDQYSGSNPHDHHVHVTFAFTEAADDNTSYDYRFEEIGVALSSDDKQWITGEIRRNLAEALDGVLGDVVVRRNPDGTVIGGDNPTMTVSSALEYGAYYADNARWQIGSEVLPALERIEQALNIP